MSQELTASPVLKSSIDLVPQLSHEAFLSLSPSILMQVDQPFVVNFLKEPQPGSMMELIRSVLGDSSVRLRKKSRHPEALGRFQIAETSLNSFFEDPLYSSPSSKTIYRIVTSMKNEPELIDQVLGMQTNNLFPHHKRGNSATLWIDYKGQFAPTHFDELENFNLQLEGKKRFVLLPPGRINSYIHSFLQGFGHHSQAVNFDTPDQDSFSKLVKEMSDRKEVILRPGQMLYIPLGWWHHVESLGEVNINLNFWLMNSLKLLRRPNVFVGRAYKAIYRKPFELYN